mmetsp:Transcript_5160/g.11355  ORF Transcript_5160/g.11355 Transcript_5160/m.11355 type:complete len:94 (-) Transcript_5160:45-326(-)
MARVSSTLCSAFTPPCELMPNRYGEHIVDTFGRVFNANGNLSYIVHQIDREPAMMQLVNHMFPVFHELRIPFHSRRGGKKIIPQNPPKDLRRS